jgi:hypothetical protein
MPRTQKADRLGQRIRTVQNLFYVNVFICFCLATYLVIDMTQQGNGIAVILIGFFMYVNVGLLFLGGASLGRQQKPAYYFCLGIIPCNAFVVYSGAFGLAEFVVFFLDVVIFIMLLALGRDYLAQS